MPVELPVPAATITTALQSQAVEPGGTFEDQDNFSTGMGGTATLHLMARLQSPDNGKGNAAERDRGDVPGWVMITVMTVTSRSTCLC